MYFFVATSGLSDQAFLRRKVQPEQIAIEAMANGALLIPSDIGAIREIVGDSYKLLYRHDSFEELSKNIEAVLTDSKLCRNLTTYLQKRHRDKICPEHECELFEELIRHLSFGQQ